MAQKTRLVTAVLFASLLAAAPRAWADAGKLLPIIDQADCALARALPVVFDNAKMDTRSLPAVASSRHLITLAELAFQPTERLAVHAGVGLAQIVDAPAESTLRRTGYAYGGGASYALLRPEGFTVGVQLNATHVDYGASGFTDETMVVALSMR